MWKRLGFAGFGLPSRAAWRQGVRMAVAALLAYLCTELAGLAQGYWAVITCLVIVQGSLGGTLDAGVSRLYGTIAGALLGALGAWMQARTAIPQLAILLAVILPLSLLAAANQKFRLGPVTAALVLLAIPSGGASFGVALNRIAEIALGSVIGALTALLVLPGRGASALHEHGATALGAAGGLARAYLAGSEDADLFNHRLRAAISRAETACAEAMRERAVHLADGPPPEPLMRTLRRLRTDVAMLGRAMSVGPGSQQLDILAQAVDVWFDAAGKALKAGRTAPDLTPVTTASASVAEDTALGFSLITLRHDMMDLCERLEERTTAG